MINNRNVILTSIGAIAVTLVGALLANVLSPVFSPLSESIKDDITSKPITNITRALTFNSDDQKVDHIVKSGDTIASSSITFYFTSQLNNTILPISIPPQLRLNYAPNFECSFDGAKFEACVSPKTYDKLNTEVGHSFQVRATGMLGNLDKHPANFTFTTTTSANIEGIIKNNTDKQSNAKLIIGTPTHILFNKTLDMQGGFQIEGIGQGNHMITIYSKSNGNPYFDYFFVPAGQQELMKKTFDINNMTPTSTPPKINFSNPNTPNSKFKAEPDIKNISFNSTQIPLTNKASKAGNFPSSLYYNELKSANIIAKTKDNSIISLLQESIKTNETQNPFKTTIWMNATDEALSGIDKVVYYLHPTFNPNVITASKQENNFGITFTNWNFSNLYAKVFFTGGTIKDLQLPSDKWKIS